jgi:hypothetical protein
VLRRAREARASSYALASFLYREAEPYVLFVGARQLRLSNLNETQNRRNYLWLGTAIGAFGIIVVADDPGWHLVVPLAVLGMTMGLLYWRFVTMADRGTG